MTTINKKQLGKNKIQRNPITFDPNQKKLRKPNWIRVKLPSTNAVENLKKKLKNRNLVTVCEEASCPNIHECFNKGTATFMILGDICTRRCAFCDVAHGRPNLPDPNEPENLANAIYSMQLSYIVITSVDRDDLKDGGAQHFVDCMQKVRELNPNTVIEILTPDFRGKNKMQRALEIFAPEPPDVFNHNLETVKPLYKQVRPGADYEWSLTLLAKFKQQHPTIPTKSGIMVGLGETFEQVVDCMQDMRKYQIDMITIGQYLQPTSYHHPVIRYWTPEEFKQLEVIGYKLGFTHVASGPLVRSSYHADEMATQSGMIQSAI